MNKGYLGGFISSDIKESDVSCKDGSTLKKARFSIACNRKGKDKGADFIYVVALGKNAENIIKYFSKGRGIIVTYHISTGSFTDKDGKTVYTEDKVIDEFEFPYVKKSEEDSTNAHEVNENHEQTSEPPKAPDTSFNDIPDDLDNMELPFK